MAEIELAAVSKVCLNRRIANEAAFEHEVAAYERSECAQYADTMAFHYCRCTHETETLVSCHFTCLT